MKKDFVENTNPAKQAFPFAGGTFRFHFPGSNKPTFSKVQGIPGMTRVALTGNVEIVEETVIYKKKPLKVSREIKEGVFVARGKYSGADLRAIRARTHNANGELQR